MDADADVDVVVDANADVVVCLDGRRRRTGTRQRLRQRPGPRTGTRLRPRPRTGPRPRPRSGIACRLSPVACRLFLPAFALLLTLGLTAACSRNINLLPALGDGGAAGTGGGDTNVTPTCTGLGDPITLPTASGPTCAAALASRGHRYVLCSCESLSAPARIRSDSFDSRTTPAFTEADAAFGINGDLMSTAEVRAGGAFHVAGAGGLRAQNHIRSAASLRVGGPLAMLSDNTDVGTDAYVNGDVSGSNGSVRVNGTLHMPPTATRSGDVQYGALALEAVSVPAPCDCSAGFADVPAAIAAAAASNADTMIGLSPSTLATVPSAKELQLPCGTFYLDDINADAPVTITVRGRTLLVVAGDVTIRDGFTVALDPSAELDLLVGGWLTISGGSFGAAAAPSRFRVWVAGTDSITFDNAPTVSAVVHAPLAPVSAPSGLPLSGSILARSFAIGSDSTLHFDRAILEAGVVCGAPAAVPPP